MMELDKKKMEVDPVPQMDCLGVQESTVLLPMKGDLAYCAVVISDVGEKYSLNVKYPLRIKGEALVRAYHFALETNYRVYPAYIGVDKDGCVNMTAMVNKTQGSENIEAFADAYAQRLELISDTFHQLTEEIRAEESVVAPFEALVHGEIHTDMRAKVSGGDCVDHPDMAELLSEEHVQTETAEETDFSDVPLLEYATEADETLHVGKRPDLPLDARILTLGSEHPLAHILAHIPQANKRYTPRTPGI